MLPRPDNTPLRPGATDRLIRAIKAQDDIRRHLRASRQWLAVAMLAIVAAFLGRDTLPGILAGVVGLGCAFTGSWHLTEAEEARAILDES